MTVGRNIRMKKAKYIYHSNSKIYALYFAHSRTMYYNTAFEGGVKVYLLVQNEKKDQVQST